MNTTIVTSLVLICLASIAHPVNAQEEIDPYLSAIQSENRKLRDENFKLRQKIASQELEGRLAKKVTVAKPAEIDEEPYTADRSQEAERDATQLYAEHFAATQGVADVPEAQQAQDGKAQWTGQLALGGNTTGGNTEGYRVNADARLMRKTTGHRTTVTANGDYAETAKTTTARQFTTNAEDRRDFNEKSFVKTNIGYHHNDLLGIDHQSRVAVGAGYYLTKSETTEWTVDVGPAYLYEDRHHQKSSHLANARLGHEIKHSLSSNLRLFQNGEVLARVDDLDEWRYNTEAGIETDISDHMSLRLSGRNRFESEVIEDRKHNDFSVGASLVFKLD